MEEAEEDGVYYSQEKEMRELGNEQMKELMGQDGGNMNKWMDEHTAGGIMNKSINARLN